MYIRGDAKSPTTFSRCGFYGDQEVTDKEYRETPEIEITSKDVFQNWQWRHLVNELAKIEGFKLKVHSITCKGKDI